MSQTGSFRAPRFQRFSVWLAALALAVQIFVVQPHVDLALAVQPQAHASAQVTQSHEESQAACVICQALAISGFATLAKAPAPGLISHAMVDITPARAQALAFGQASHHWRSRGPPVL